MRKITALILIILIFFCGCKTKTYTPEITDFEQNASVVSGIFSYSCKICRKNGKVTVTATSTNAEGMTIIYDGVDVRFSYDDMNYQLGGDKIEKTNPAIAIYDAFEYITSAENENLNASKTDKGFKYEGTTDLGDFVLLQNDDFSYDSLYFKNANLSIVFAPSKQIESEMSNSAYQH